MFTEAELDGARLPGAIVRGCDLTGASLHGARLRAADLRGSTLESLKLGAGDLAGAIIDPIQLVALARTLAALAGITVSARLGDGGAAGPGVGVS